MPAIEGCEWCKDKLHLLVLENTSRMVNMNQICAICKQLKHFILLTVNYVILPSEWSLFSELLRQNAIEYRKHRIIWTVKEPQSWKVWINLSTFCFLHSAASSQQQQVDDSVDCGWCRRMSTWIPKPLYAEEVGGGVIEANLARGDNHLDRCMHCKGLSFISERFYKWEGRLV